jgi:hypothetical protein
MQEDALAEALARRAGLEIALRDHREEVLAAARRARAAAEALRLDLPPEAEPAPAQRIEGAR